MPSYQHRRSHCKDKIISRPFHLYNGNPYTWNHGLYIETSIFTMIHGVSVRPDLFGLLVRNICAYDNMVYHISCIYLEICSITRLWDENWGDSALTVCNILRTGVQEVLLDAYHIPMKNNFFWHKPLTSNLECWEHMVQRCCLSL